MRVKQSKTEGTGEEEGKCTADWVFSVKATRLQVVLEFKDLNEKIETKTCDLQWLILANNQKQFSRLIKS